MNSIKLTYKCFNQTIQEFKKIEQALQKTRQLIDMQPLTILLKKLNEFPKKFHKYVAWKMYRLAFYGYPINTIINEINFYKEIKKCLTMLTK